MQLERLVHGHAPVGGERPSNVTTMTRLAAGLLSLAALTSTGCALRNTAVQTITIQPQRDPVVVTATGTAVCTDYGIIRTAKEELNLKSSNG